jgi:hypothetical protein
LTSSNIGQQETNHRALFLVKNHLLDNLLVETVTALGRLSNKRFLDLLVELSGALVENWCSFLHYDEL